MLECFPLSASNEQSPAYNIHTYIFQQWIHVIKYVYIYIYIYASSFDPRKSRSEGHFQTLLFLFTSHSPLSLSKLRHLTVGESKTASGAAGHTGLGFNPGGLHIHSKTRIVGGGSLISGAGEEWIWVHSSGVSATDRRRHLGCCQLQSNSSNHRYVS